MSANENSRQPRCEQEHLFTSGQDGYHTYRIPALAVSGRGTLLAFAEGRRHGRGDAGEIDLILRRSFDGGSTWTPIQVVVTEAGMTCGNPCPVVERETGAIWLPFCKNLADGDETMICEGKAPRTVWITHSVDDGQSWSEPREITSSVKDPKWTWYATGPCHGIQLASGRLVVPCDHIVGLHFDRSRDPYHSHVIYSDDRGETWQLGGDVEAGTNECAIAQLQDGSLYINCRNFVRGTQRAVARSYDQGQTFTDFEWDETLIEPVCQGSLDALPDGQLLFANPASARRERMTVRLSPDGGRTWPAAQTLHTGPSAYSDLAALPGGDLCCLYESGESQPYERLTLARFNLAWLNREPEL